MAPTKYERHQGRWRNGQMRRDTAPPDPARASSPGRRALTPQKVRDTPFLYELPLVHND